MRRPIFSIAPGEGREGLGFEVVSCFSCKRILAGHVSTLAARYVSTVVALSVVTGNNTCLLKVKFSLQLQMCAA